MIPIPFVQRHAGAFAAVVAIAITRLIMSGAALWLQVLVAAILSVVVWALLYKKGVTPRRRKSSLFGTSVNETHPE